MEIQTLAHQAAKRLLRKFGYELPDIQIQDAQKLLTQREKLRTRRSGDREQQPSETATGLRTYSEGVKFVTVTRRVDLNDPRSKENTQVFFPLTNNHKIDI